MVPQPFITLERKTFADTFSWLPHCDVLTISVGENDHVVLFDFTSEGLGVSDDPDLLKCFLNLPNSSFTKHQNMGTDVATKTAKYPEQLFNKFIHGCVIVCHALPNKDCLTQWNIALTKEMVIPLIN